MHLKSVQVIFYEIDILVLRLNQNVATYILIWIYIFDWYIKYLGKQLKGINPMTISSHIIFGLLE